MKLYRNHRWTSEDSSLGFSWFASKRAAEAEAAADPASYEDAGSPTSLAEIARPFDVQLRVSAVLDLLGAVAVHPDNG